jgi:hypothetical protein
MRPIPRTRRRFGCVGLLIFCAGVVLALYGLIAPWSFHIGDRWTPLVTWTGVGQLRDSTGAQYGLYASFFPYFRGTSRLGGGHDWPRCGLRGQAWVCTANGTKYKFDLRGQIYGAWLNSVGKELTLSLNEKPGRRHFTLYGAFRGTELVLDDHKTMFMYFRPDGTLTPSGSYTSPVPEKHANVTLDWGSYSDFEAVCASLARSPAH